MCQPKVDPLQEGKLVHGDKQIWTTRPESVGACSHSFSDMSSVRTSQAESFGAHCERLAHVERLLRHELSRWRMSCDTSFEAVGASRERRHLCLAAVASEHQCGKVAEKICGNKQNKGNEWVKQREVVVVALVVIVVVVVRI